MPEAPAPATPPPPAAASAATASQAGHASRAWGSAGVTAAAGHVRPAASSENAHVAVAATPAYPVDTLTTTAEGQAAAQVAADSTLAVARVEMEPYILDPETLEQPTYVLDPETLGNPVANKPTGVLKTQVTAATDYLGEKSKYIGDKAASATSYLAEALKSTPAAVYTREKVAAAADYLDAKSNYLGHKAASATNCLGETLKSTTSLPGPVGEGARALEEGGRVFGRWQTALVLALATPIPLPLPLNSLVNLSVGPALAAGFSLLGIARSRPHIQRLLSVCPPPSPSPSLPSPPLPSLLRNFPLHYPKLDHRSFTLPSSLPPPISPFPVRCL